MKVREIFQGTFQLISIDHCCLKTMFGTNAPVIQCHFPEKQRPQNKIML